MSGSPSMGRSPNKAVAAFFGKRQRADMAGQRRQRGGDLGHQNNMRVRAIIGLAQ